MMTRQPLSARLCTRPYPRPLLPPQVVIGVHGAGLTNIIASSPGAAVFEILTTAFPGLHYAEYSVVMGLEYHR